MLKSKNNMSSGAIAPILVLVSTVFSTYAYSAIPQPSPTGSILEGRLSDANENGAYTVKKPYTDGASNAVGQLLITYQRDGQSDYTVCSGSILNNDTHKNLVITAAHCFAERSSDKVWKKKAWLDAAIKAKTITFSPSYNGYNEGSVKYPYGLWVVKDVHLLANDKAGTDVALLEIAPNTNGDNVRDVVGNGYDVHAPIKSGDKIQATLVGYPGPAPFYGQSQAACVGNYTYHEGRDNGTISRVDDEKECWVGGGASGGPYLSQPSNKGGFPQIITVLNSSGGGDVPSVYDRLLKLLE